MAEPDSKEKPAPKPPESEPVVSEHTIEIAGGAFAYTATTGRLELKNHKEETEARVFFVAYQKKDRRPDERRPLMFSFNGGPGSASVWLHFGALGPYRVKMLDDGAMPAPPYELEFNPETWLADTDLVFIDPVGTGYSRAETEELGPKFWGVKGDIESIAEFIRLFLTKYERWDSPLFLVGESYGTTRAAGLSGYLIERGIAFNGILLVSSILNFLTARFVKGNDLPYVLFLPTYAATAWFHGKLPAKYQKDLKSTLREVEEWAVGDYLLALAKGDRLPPADRKRTLDRLSAYTGLSKAFLDQSDLRIEIMAFCKELLRSEKRTVGRLDTRFKGIDGKHTGERFEHDPSMTAIRPPYTAMANHYYRTVLGYKTDVPYYILGEGIEKPWDWGSAGEGHPDTSEALRTAFSKNPYMKVFVASGYYDLATPYFATRHTLAHLGLDPTQRENVTTADYRAGHMMYIDVGELKRLRDDVFSFVRAALG